MEDSIFNFPLSDSSSNVNNSKSTVVKKKIYKLDFLNTP